MFFKGLLRPYKYWAKKKIKVLKVGINLKCVATAIFKISSNFSEIRVRSRNVVESISFSIRTTTSNSQLLVNGLI